MPLKNVEFSEKITQKIDKMGKYELYMTPIQKDLIDNFSIQDGDMTLSRVILNGHFGTGKTYTLLLGIRRLVDLIQKRHCAQNHMIVFLSAKDEYRQKTGQSGNGDGHLKDAFQFLECGALVLYKSL